MEVHTHTHTARKKWTHYFWEFLMLFLAVFCGFLAEYQLEHKIEKDREKEYMQSMLTDLQNDTTSINEALAGNESLLKGLDTVLSVLAKPGNDKDYEKRLFLYSVKYTYWFFNVEYSQLTLSQLKNSGGYRLIKNKEVAAAIVGYSEGLEWSKWQFTELVHYFHQYENTQKEIINWSTAKGCYVWLDSNKLNMLRPMEEMEKLVTGENYILSKTPAQLSRYYSELLFYTSAMKNLNTNFRNQKQKAVTLIKLIRENYKIKI
ncbi:MAG: hypothetical protein ACT4OJ_12285 [Bacteroidota bacterium]